MGNGTNGGGGDSLVSPFVVVGGGPSRPGGGCPWQLPGGGAQVAGAARPIRLPIHRVHRALLALPEDLSVRSKFLDSWTSPDQLPLELS